MVMTQVHRPAKQQAELKAQKALAQSIWERMEREAAAPPAPIATRRGAPIDWDALERQARQSSGRNGDGDQVYRCSRGFKTSVSDSFEEPDADGHVIWTGDFKVTSKGRDEFPRPARGGIHELCGRSHHFVARAFKEEALGYALPEDVDVVNTCGLAACVAPDHFRLRYPQA